MNNLTSHQLKGNPRLSKYLKFLFIAICLAFVGCSVSPKQKAQPGSTDLDDQIKVDAKQSTEPPSTHYTLSDIEKTQYKQAVRNINRGDFDLAEKSLKHLIKAYPKHAGMLANLATISYQRGDISQAKKINERALSANNNEVLALNLQGLLFLNEDKIIQAEQSFLLATKNDASYALAYFNLAVIYDTYYQDIAQAVQYYRRYLVLSDFQDELTKTWLSELELNLEGNE